MRRILLVAFVTVLALAAWTGLWATGVIAGWSHTPIAPRGDTAAFAKAAAAKIDAEHKGVASFALIEKGKVVATHFASTGTPVNDDTLYQVASLSKWVTSWGVMHLVEQGKVDLDKPVDTYLKRWHLPNSGFDNRKVTVRRLLSHTAGLVDGLGYAGFKPGEKVQTVVESLTHTADASPGRDGYVRVGMEPGSQWKYSGGGYTILQLMIEDVSGEPFNDYMRETVLTPLGMARSTYVLPEGGGMNIAGFYDPEGKPAIHYRFAALAAASLYTSTHDMARFIAANSKGANGEPAGRGVLKPSTLAEMRKPLAYQYGAAIWGMGNILFAENNTGDWIVGHDGDNEPAINTTARVDPSSGDGIVVLESGNDLLASDIGGEWTFWRTGNIDLITAVVDFNRFFPLLAGGWIAITLAGLIFGWRTWRRRA
ncbi:MAG TPA: serine hydrolase domain-containing protein [Rhizomicrobium sp.]|jgi:CubicO group peptidase (beta-lactamase class C family)|nr:serine hydrolase domain-containing protein [Rhizomicrobium sp.]